VEKILADLVDLQYANMLSGRLDRHIVKRQHPYKANFRCSYCGDSQKSKSKMRGWIVEHEKTGALHYHCFNCGASESFVKYLKQFDGALYNSYIADRYVRKLTGDQQQNDSEDALRRASSGSPPVFNPPLFKLKKISQLKHDHPARRYIDRRQIPVIQHHRIFYAPKFVKWVSEVAPGKLTGNMPEHPRIVLPFFDKHKKLFGVSARGFDPNGLRYVSIMFDDRPKLFGLEQVDFGKTYFVVEGAFDSLFLSNSIAMAGADGNHAGLENLDNAVFVFDAEPRNVQICARMQKLLVAGHKVCIWPSTVIGKDINEMFLAGNKDVELTIRQNIYSGLQGQLQLQCWKKC
jgi:transcription elongation factor Elf1